MWYFNVDQHKIRLDAYYYASHVSFSFFLFKENSTIILSTLGFFIGDFIFFFIIFIFRTVVDS